MKSDDVSYEDLPQLHRPILIAAFAGWGNALSVASDMAAYLIAGLKAIKFAEIDPDSFYRYDENRPQVSIVEGTMTGFSMPTGSFYAAHTKSDQRDVIVFKGNEPALSWNRFIAALFSLSRKLGVDTIITLGSMFDQVLHTDMVISGIASSEQLRQVLIQKGVTPISYQGPSAIHSVIQVKGTENQFNCMSLWCHCPFYIQCAQHFGYLAKLGALLSSLGEFHLDTNRLNRSWKKLERQIADLIAGNPELQNMVERMKKKGTPSPGTGLRNAPVQKDKIIDLRDFLTPRKNDDKD